MSYLCLHDNYGGNFGLKNYEILERERLNSEREREWVRSIILAERLIIYEIYMPKYTAVYMFMP